MSKNNKKSSRSTLPNVHEEDLFVVVHTETGRALERRAALQKLSDRDREVLALKEIL